MAHSVAEFPRRFLPDRIDLGDWARIEPYFQNLALRPIDSPQDFADWLQDFDELSACLHEEQTTRYTAMTCQTDDPERERRYLHMVTSVRPKARPWEQKLLQRWHDCRLIEQLPNDVYFVFNRDVRRRIELYREENIPLFVEEDKLTQRYQKIAGAMTVEYDGQERTLQQMQPYLELPDRDTRRQAWELVSGRRLQDGDALDDLFDELLRLRQQIAVNAGFENYRDYAFKALGRYDYGPQDCLRFHQAVEQTFVPLRRAIDRRRQQMLGLPEYRPWDTAVDPRQLPPLRPFESADQLVSGCRRIIARLSPELGEQFTSMADAGLLDLESRKGKAPGGYMASLYERRLPFIFMNAVGLHRDVETLLHESGHALHTLASRGQPILAYREDAPIEFAEVASMGMELLATPHLDVFYSDDDRRRAWREQLEGIVRIFGWIATIDAFQYWIYTHRDHTREQRTDAWLQVYHRFAGLEDFSGYEPALQCLWHRQLHLFLHPFYYVEYGIAQLGALQVWRNASAAGETAAVQAYRRALALGGSRPLPELFQTAGLRFDFTIDSIRPLAEHIQQELDALD